jgi:cytochrome c-type biogenesis protein CcmH
MANRPCDKENRMSHTLLLPRWGGYIRLMLFWFIAGLLALMTGVILARSGRQGSILADPQDGALAVYKDQLKELERDVATGAVSAQDADAQRTEISRRLLQAAREQKASQRHDRRNMPWPVALIVPVIAALAYWQLGSPQLPDVPRAERLAAAVNTGDVVAMVAMVEERLENVPDDLEGWRIVLVEYQRAGRFADAANAQRNIMRLQGETGAGYADLAELLTFAEKGLISAEASAAAREALRREPQNPKAMFYAALALKQEGKAQEALSLFTLLASRAPPDAPFLATVKEEIASLQKSMPASSAPEISMEQMEEGMGQSPEERQQMILSMVNGLEQRLAQNGDDLEGWLRLIRARAVLGERDKAAASLAAARKLFETNAVAMTSLAELAKQANLP